MGRRVIIDELEFEVAYGKLAAKSWHEDTDDCRRVLALHGWMDNSGSFDNLIPKLKTKDDLYIVALDLPGHGKSSQLPPGTFYSDLGMIMEIRRVLIELNWASPTAKQTAHPNGDHAPVGIEELKITNQSSSSSSSSTGGSNSQRKFTIIGHSLGAGLGLFYASLFPDDVDKVILLDFIKPRTTSIECLLTNTSNIIDQFINTVPAQSPYSSPMVGKPRSMLSPMNPSKSIDKGQVVVSQETAIIATIDAHKQLGTLTREEAACLLKRSTVAVSTPPNSVIYSRDLRLQSMLNLREHWDMFKVMFNHVKCHVVSILSKQGIYIRDPLFKDHLEDVLVFIRERAQSFEVEWVDGDHYLHMNKPQATANLVSKYLDIAS